MMECDLLKKNTVINKIVRDFMDTLYIIDYGAKIFLEFSSFHSLMGGFSY